ncbi:hypothetical protein PLESTM_000666500 [Pleodorina starrii]|nr:hypothetical protein PLESTM_000666500 [Pleodorina starrii]
MYMMREKELRECALPNVSFVAENCVSIPESSCSSKSSCDVRMFGLVFPDDECFVIINKGSSPLSITIRLNNFFDRPRYYGTVFTLFFGVVGSLAILANVAWQFYTIIIAPVNRHHEPVKVKRDDPVKRRDDVESDSSASATATGASAVRAAWYQKIMSKLRPTQVANGHIA